ncbi:MAG: hypothetical protein K8T25_16670 [Planctomycetia bacterium]|nr:hypothetical protein [Planctomycetia bacterium]
MRQHAIGPASPRQKEYAAYLRTSAWKEKVEQVRVRCGGTCEHCHKMAFSHTHHLTYERIYNERLDDLLGVCEPCHEFLHKSRTDDGAAVFAKMERQQKSRERQSVSYAEATSRSKKEDERQATFPDRYEIRVCADYREIMGLLRQFPFLLNNGWLSVMTDIARSARKWNPTGVDCWLWHLLIDDTYRANRVENADESLVKGDILFDKERRIWSVKTGAVFGSCSGVRRTPGMSPKAVAVRNRLFQSLSDKMAECFG